MVLLIIAGRQQEVFHRLFAHINRRKDQVHRLGEHQHSFQPAIPEVPLNKHDLEKDGSAIPICATALGLHRIPGEISRDHSTECDTKRIENDPISESGTR